MDIFQTRYKLTEEMIKAELIEDKKDRDPRLLGILEHLKENFDVAEKVSQMLDSILKFIELNIQCKSMSYKCSQVSYEKWEKEYFKSDGKDKTEIDKKDNKELFELKEQIQEQNNTIDIYDKKINDVSKNYVINIDFSPLERSVSGLLKSTVSYYESILKNKEEEIQNNPQNVNSNDEQYSM